MVGKGFGSNFQPLMLSPDLLKSHYDWGGGGVWIPLPTFDADSYAGSRRSGAQEGLGKSSGSRIRSNANHKNRKNIKTALPKTTTNILYLFLVYFLTYITRYNK